jgi:hypothetical protein
MAQLAIAHQRLFNQWLSAPASTTPADVVSRLGAVQSQDYAGARWALGLRLADADDSTVERAFADGSILRTHVLRPTWHFVTPPDIRWLLALTAPRVNVANAHYYRRLELDEAVFARSNAALRKALQGGKQLTRDQLRLALQQDGIATESPLRLGYIVMRAELDGVICSGPRRGKQFTYMLLDERVPASQLPDHEQALAELTRRYFTSHGPAMVQDFVWWSGLTLTDARNGLDMVKSELVQEVVDGRRYWFASPTSPIDTGATTAYLLPNYDEYTVSYRDHSGVFDPTYAGNLIFSHTTVIDGRVTGTWKRTLKKDAVIIESDFFTPPAAAEYLAFESAAQRYGAFLHLPVVLA